jgi:hypothetical protein
VAAKTSSTIDLTVEDSVSTFVPQSSVGSSSSSSDTAGLAAATNSLLLDLAFPQSSRDICGNKRTVRRFKRWLQEWLLLDDTRNRQRLQKRKRKSGGTGGRTVSKKAIDKKFFHGYSTSSSRGSQFSHSEGEDNNDALSEVYYLIY